MVSLPEFSLGDYATLLTMLRGAEYQFCTVAEMRMPTGGRVAYLRHDIDFHVSLIYDMAELENKCAVRTTYFVPLTLHFNVLYPPNQSLLKKILALGHEIGLHYDLVTYPINPNEARRRLDWEANILSEIIGAPIHSIVMHQPHKGSLDMFRMLDEYVNPHAPCYQGDLLYVSDSCRAWRDESLLTCFGLNPPRRLMLNIHPELWLDGSLKDRMDYLDAALLESGVRQHREYFEQAVRQVWLTHPAPKLHAERERRKANTR